MAKQGSIRVLMVIGLYHPVIGGAEKVCRAMSKSFTERGMTVSVLTQYAAGLPDHEVIDGIAVYRKMRGWHPLGISYMLSVLWFLLKYRHRFDIIQCFGLFLFIPPANLIRFLFKKKLVLRLLCSGPYGDFAGIEKLALKGLVKICAKRSDAIVSLSNDITGELLQNRFPANRIVSIPNAVDGARFVPPTTPNNEDVRKICFVGRIEIQKGLTYLLRALAIILARGCRVKLFLVGDGTQRGALEGLARDLCIGDHVVFCGFQHDVLDYFHHARAFVLPSLSEGMSSALLEAMSCGLPVITTRVGASEEMVGADLRGDGLPIGQYRMGKRGIVVNPRDEEGLAAAISRLLEDDGLSEGLGDSARAFVCSSYSHEGMVSAYQDLYGRLFQSSPRCVSNGF